MNFLAQHSEDLERRHAAIISEIAENEQSIRWFCSVLCDQPNECAVIIQLRGRIESLVGRLCNELDGLSLEGSDAFSTIRDPCRTQSGIQDHPYMQVDTG